MSQVAIDTNDQLPSFVHTFEQTLDTYLTVQTKTRNSKPFAFFSTEYQSGKRKRRKLDRLARKKRKKERNLNAQTVRYKKLFILEKKKLLQEEISRANVDITKFRAITFSSE